MPNDRQDKLNEIYGSALKLDAAQRVAFVRQACREDDGLRAEIESLLAQEERVGSFQEKPAIGAAAVTVGGVSLYGATQTMQLGLNPGSLFANRYEIHGQIGRGGFGVVYCAFDRGPLQREIALKLIRFETAASPEQGVVVRRRFLKEARTAGSLSHSNIATVFDVGEWSGIVYMTQELAPGRDLRKLLAESRQLPLRRVIAVIRQMCEGLAHAHAKGIVHRDIKPGNIVLDAMDRVKITDFGLAKPPQDEDPTLENRPVGTPGYMAPEQLRGEPIDPRADIFAVGCVLYEMLAGRAPFEGSTVARIVEKTLHGFPPGPSQVREDLPHTLDRIVGRAMKKDRDERYSSITLLEQELLHYEQFDHLLDRKQGASDVAAALEARQCAVFLGLRLPTGMNDKPARTADELIAEYLAEHLGAPVKNPSLSKVAQNLEMERGRPEMLRYLAAAVRQPGVSSHELVRRVARLPFPLIVTTRYDNFLEEELTKAGRKIHRVLDCRNVPENPVEGDLLVRLFGSVETEASVIVTEDDLWNFFGTFGSVADALKSVFARQRLLFVGYDPEDEGFRHLFSEIERFRAGVKEGCYLPVADAALSVVRWTQRKGLRLVDSEPGAFLSLLEETFVERRRQKAVSTEPVPEAPLPSRPYKFLNYYDERDERIFFGRQGEAHRLLTKIHAYALNLLYAPSGSGKTSLICAALMPQLSRQGYSPVYTRVYDSPEGEILRAALEATRASASEFPAGVPLETLLPQLAARTGRRLVIFVDQFEEIFIRYDHQARDRFAATLQAVLAEAKGQVRFVLSLREDFLARVSEFRDRIPNIFHNEFRLGPLTEDESRAAIIEPPKLLGIEVETELVDRLIADLSREGIDPPQLQIVCDTLFDRLNPGEKRLTLKSYVALGETRKILANYLERTLQELPQQERETARETLKNLVTSERTKTLLRISDLVRAVGQPEEDVTRVLSDLSNRRLIRGVQHEEGFWYELAHEYLVEEISRWLSEKEKELKRIRELLEQSVRNHRNLGMLMPSAQLRLVMAHEDDLHLSKEERQLLRASEVALGARQKRLALAVALSAVFLVICGTAWRYLYLSTHVFVKAQDKEYIDLNSSSSSGAKVAYRLENIRVYAGAPEHWWLDVRLGFPKPLYQTDFELDQLDPARRDAVKGGLVFPRSASMQDAILNMLQPDAKVRFLITTGRVAEAVRLLRTLYKDDSVDQAELDSIPSMLAYSEIQDEDVIGDVLRHTLRVGASEFPGYLLDSVPVSLAAFLLTYPPPPARADLIPFLGIAASRSRALAIAGLLGNREDASLAVPYLEASFREEMLGTVKSSALLALDNLGDCSALAAVRQIVRDPQSGPNALYAALQYVRRCGGTDDLSLLERMARPSMAAGSLFATFFVPGIIEAMYQMAGSPSIPAIRSIVTNGPMTDWKLAALEDVLDPKILPDIALGLEAKQPAVQARAAEILAKWGRPVGLPAMARISIDQGQEIGVRVRALGTFQWFKGPRLRGFLLNVFRNSPTEGKIREAALHALQWYDDDETLSVLGQGLTDQDSAVRRAALGSLNIQRSTRTRVWLHSKVRAPDPMTRLYAARALQASEGANYPDLFRAYLNEHADATSDYALLVQAIIGLRDSYLAQPAAEVVEALRDPRRDVRLAATLALIEHPQGNEVTHLLARAASDKDPWFHLAALRAEWAVGVARKQAALRDAAGSAFPQSDVSHARQTLNRIGYGLGDRSLLPLKMEFTAPRPVGESEPFSSTSYVFDEIFSPKTDPFEVLQNTISLRDRSYGSFLARLTSLVSADPTLGKSIREDPQTSPLRGFYEFRVLTDMQPPTVIENIDLPEVLPRRH